MAVLTQGTQLYFVDPDNFSIVEVDCVTTLTGITASRDQIETTCLNGTSRTYEPGMATPGAAQFGINFDPSTASHVRLHELYVAGTKVNWALGWSDGTAAPTANSNGGLVLPSSRTWIDWNGFLSDVPFDFSINAVVTSSVSLQLSDFPTLTAKV